MSKIFTIEDIRQIIHGELANFAILKNQTNNQDKLKQILIKYGTEILIKLLSEFEKQRQANN